MKNIYTIVGINIKDCDIVNHSGQSTPIAYLFQKGIAMGTNMFITGYKKLEASIKFKISSFKPVSTLNPNLTKLFCQPLCKTTNANLILHTNALKHNLTIGGHQKFYKVPQADNLYESQEDNLYEPHKDNFYEPWEDNKGTSSVSIIKNYYIIAEHVNIN
ncbi:hypothetical protein F8M41_023687 [Gigaspora margarita]|uniref:Uncharacterized protein n=1 Tax=Gigaspora margarita TaxID=4874 RepID=A0A8H4ACZ7_GIGMA|nr:hypothetical protein F8M41_023687 [Gigaspora margarita]